MKQMKTKMMLIVIMGIFITSAGLAQTWQIGYTTMTFVDATRNNRQIETEIYYPADIAGNGMDLGSPLIKKYPVIVFGHDQNVAWNYYEYFWNRFASQGFIVAVPKTEAGVSMDVVEFAKDMAFIIQRIKVMRYQPGTFFYQRINGKSSFIGHGTGGSAATFAVQYHPTVTTLVSLAATETVPSAINAATLVTVPSVVVGGGDDCVSPIATNQMPMFNNIDSDCKTFINLLDATHCHFAQNEGVCSSLQVLCPATSASWQNTAWNSNYLLISFLRYYLKSNAPAYAKFQWKLDSKKKDWSYVMYCNQNAPRLSADEGELDRVMDMDIESTTAVSFYPNPVSAGSALNLVVAAEESTSATVIITNLMGQVVSQEQISLDESEKAITLSTDQFKSGYYMVSVISNEGRISKPLIIQ